LTGKAGSDTSGPSSSLKVKAKSAQRQSEKRSASAEPATTQIQNRNFKIQIAFVPPMGSGNYWCSENGVFTLVCEYPIR
jgi:hypothetical protein